jgi:Asp-tRNA(Asn)/Glu-tRNA(Gln) amidotransferase A subunit family amidase
MQHGVAAYYVIAPAEASSNLSRFRRRALRPPRAEYSDLNDMYQKSRAQGFGAEVKRRILIGTYVLSHGYYDAYYLQAQRIRRLIANDFVEAFQQCDVIMGPTSPAPLSARREGGRSGADVSVGHLHHRRQPGRPARHVDSLRFRRRAAGRPATDRQLFFRSQTVECRTPLPASVLEE